MTSTDEYRLFMGLDRNLAKTKYRELVEIENSLGMYAATCYKTGYEEERKVAGQLFDAICKGDVGAVRRIADRYAAVVTRYRNNRQRVTDNILKNAIGLAAEKAVRDMAKWENAQHNNQV